MSYGRTYFDLGHSRSFDWTEERAALLAVLLEHLPYLQVRALAESSEWPDLLQALEADWNLFTRCGVFESLENVAWTCPSGSVGRLGMLAIALLWFLHDGNGRPN